MSELFRKEAIDHATRRLSGTVVITSFTSASVVGLLLVATLGAAVLFASLASYNRTEEVQGWVVPQGGLVRVEARQGGVVTSIHVHEGSSVREGTPLVELRLSTDGSVDDANRSLTRDFATEGEAIRVQSGAGIDKLAAQRSEMILRRSVLSREIAELMRTVKATESRQELAQAQVARAQSMPAGYISGQAIDALRSTELTAAQDASQAREAVLEAKRQIGDLDGDIKVASADLTLARAQSTQNEAGLAERRTASEMQNVTITKASIDGQVVAIPVELGQTVASNGTIAVLAPDNAPLTAELFVPSSAAGFIRVGQEVGLKYEAFPYQTFGTGRGMVTAVSKTSLLNSEISLPGLNTQQPVFRVRVKIFRPSVEAYGHAQPLRPGMLLSADVVIDHRNLLEWILDPFYAAGKRL